MYDLIIIGAGPAGLTAALYAGRSKLKTLVLENTMVGGQINLTETIENFPGFSPSINSQDLVARFKEQIKGFDIEIVEEGAVKIEQENDKKIIKAQTKEFISRAIIIATGAGPKRLGVPGEDNFIGRGVSYCGICDAPIFKEKIVCAVGGGNMAIEEALHIIKFAKEVILIHRRDKFRADKILVERLLKNSRIRTLLDTIVLEISGEDRVKTVTVKNVKTDKNTILSCQGVFIFAGRIPHTDFLKNFLKLDPEGYIITDDNLETSIKGVFACGDCRKKPLYQIVTACAEGAIAAYNANRYLQGN